eukprot:118032_1
MMAHSLIICFSIVYFETRMQNQRIFTSINAKYRMLMYIIYKISMELLSDVLHRRANYQNHQQLELSQQIKLSDFNKQNTIQILFKLFNIKCKNYNKNKNININCK